MHTFNFNELATAWINAWNNRDINAIMNHYAEEVVFYAPTVIKRWNIADGKLCGKEQLRKHFLKGFELAPDLHFELITVLAGVDGMTIVYKRETGTVVADVVQLNNNGKAILVKAYYGW